MAAAALLVQILQILGPVHGGVELGIGEEGSIALAGHGPAMVERGHLRQRRGRA
jgi:hypothetical protein